MQWVMQGSEEEDLPIGQGQYPGQRELIGTEGQGPGIGKVQDEAGITLGIGGLGVGGERQGDDAREEYRMLHAAGVWCKTGHLSERMTSGRVRIGLR